MRKKSRCTVSYTHLDVYKRQVSDCVDRSIPDWIVEHGVCIAEIRLKAIIIDQTGERGIYMDERLKKQLDFILEADKVKNIMRQTYLEDGKRKENDAEHSWHLALMAVLLKEYAPEEVDLSKVIPMVHVSYTHLETR